VTVFEEKICFLHSPAVTVYGIGAYSGIIISQHEV
jgi:hypothetical protein